MGIRMMAASKNDARALPREILSGHIIYRAAPLNYSNWRARAKCDVSRTDAPPSCENGSSQIGPAWLLI
jgi:hypothetical protein